MRLILRLIGLAFVFIVVAVVSLLFLPADRLARIAADQVESYTGRTVSIDGDVRFSVWPVLGFRAKGVSVGAPAWSTAAPLLVSDEVAIGVDPIQLLNRNILVTYLEATRPVIYLEKKSDGRASWDFSSAASAPTTTVAVAEPDTPAFLQVSQAQTVAVPDLTLGTVSVERIRITDASITYHQEGASPVQFEQVSASLDWPDPNGAVEIGLELFPAGTAVVVDATVDGFSAFIAGQVQRIQAQMETAGGQFSFAGRASIDGAATGLINFRTDTTAVFLRSLGIDAAEPPANLGRQVDVTAEATLTPDQKLSLRDMNIALEKNRLVGALDMTLEEVPFINAQFDAGALNLRSLFEQSASAAPQQNSASQNSGSPTQTPQPAAGQPQVVQPAPTQAAWPTDPIDASALGLFNGEIALTASSIDLETFKLGATQTILRNDNARMVFELRGLEAYGGRVTGDFVVNNRSGLSVGGRINASEVQMQPLLDDAIDLDRLTGAASLAMEFLGSGPTVNDIMQSLSGDGLISVGRGTIQGINLDRLMRGDTAASGTTIFDNLTGTWAIAAGVLNNQDLLFQLKNYEARGAGIVGVGTQTLDYVFTPVALRANSGQGLALPVRFKGPWSDISIRPDFDAALDMRIDEEVDAAKEKVDAEIDAVTDKVDAEIASTKESVDDEIDNFAEDAKAKLERELGITPAEGQSTEDAVKDELTNQLLRKLFD